MGQLSSTLLGSADAWDAESITDLTGKARAATCDPIMRGAVHCRARAAQPWTVCVPPGLARLRLRARLCTQCGREQWSHAHGCAEHLAERCAAPQVALVTGANTGIGWEIAKELATHGARVLLAGRDKQKVDDAVKRLKACRPTCTVEGYVVDLAQFRRVRQRVHVVPCHAALTRATPATSAAPWTRSPRS
jgi:hypothetical protein